MLYLFVLLECFHFSSLDLVQLFIPDLEHLSEVIGTEQSAEVDTVQIGLRSHFVCVHQLNYYSLKLLCVIHFRRVGLQYPVHFFLLLVVFEGIRIVIFLDKLFELVDCLVLVLQLVMQLPNFLLDILNELALVLEVILLLVVIILAVLGNYNIMAVYLVYFLLEHVIGLLLNLHLVLNQVLLGLQLIDLNLFILTFLFELLSLENSLFSLIVELLLLQYCLSCSLLLILH